MAKAKRKTKPKSSAKAKTTKKKKVSKAMLRKLTGGGEPLNYYRTPYYDFMKNPATANPPNRKAPGTPSAVSRYQRPSPSGGGGGGANRAPAGKGSTRI